MATLISVRPRVLPLFLELVQGLRKTGIFNRKKNPLPYETKTHHNHQLHKKYWVALLGLVMCIFLLLDRPSQAQNYPVRPIKVINPYAPGGGSDVLARRFVQEVSLLLNQSVYVDNIAGAGGIPGMRQVAESPKDGYTLVFALTAQYAINPSVFTHLPYDPLRDFDMISLLASAPYVLVVHPSVPAKGITELIHLAKHQPEALSYASAGNGSGSHLCAAIFNQLARIQIQHIPYKGGGPGLIDVIAGRVPMTYVIYPSMAAAEKSGKLRALGVTTTKRLPSLPRVPAIAETLPGYQADVWYMLATPAGTPKEIITQLNSVFNKALVSPTLKQSLDKDGILPIGNSPTEAREFLRSEILKWAPIVKSSGARID
ncbi:MAG: tripartite tricarboxylate transporter substrate binding protein [Betaproteobacteria bacterium]